MRCGCACIEGVSRLHAMSAFEKPRKTSPMTCMGAISRRPKALHARFSDLPDRPFTS
jgi:hypothetical protein